LFQTRIEKKKKQMQKQTNKIEYADKRVETIKLTRQNGQSSSCVSKSHKIAQKIKIKFQMIITIY
jgi:hypothetical protein